MRYLGTLAAIAGPAFLLGLALGYWHGLDDE